MNNELISGRTLKLLNLADALEGTESSEDAYASRMMAQLSLPYKNPVSPDKPIFEWSRQNNSVTLPLTSGIIVTPDSRERALPYGVIPRYLLTWLTGEAIKTKSPTIELGGSLAGFMRQLGLHRNGLHIKRVSHQTQALLTTGFHFMDARPFDKRFSIAGKQFFIADEYQLWFDRENNPEMMDSTITLNQKFYQEIIKSPVRLRPEILKAFSSSPMRLDMYTWLAYRLRHLPKATVVSWKQLAGQFGAEYALERQFKAAFIKNFREVSMFMPERSCAISEKGIMLKPTKRAERELSA